MKKFGLPGLICLGVALALSPLSLPHSGPDGTTSFIPRTAAANTFIERQIRRQIRKSARRAAKQAGFRTKLPKSCVKAARRGASPALWKCGNQFFKPAKHKGKTGYVPHIPDRPSR